jgi:hypothetical protein
MDRYAPIRIKQFGNILQIILEIPWKQVHGENNWKSHFDNKPPEPEPRPNHWANLTERVLKLYKKTGNVSETAKASGAGYYIANEIIQKEGSRQRKAALAKAKEIARQHAVAKVPIKDIARMMDRSPETIRLWLKS